MTMAQPSEAFSKDPLDLCEREIKRSTEHFLCRLQDDIEKNKHSKNSIEQRRNDNRVAGVIWRSENTDDAIIILENFQNTATTNSNSVGQEILTMPKGEAVSYLEEMHTGYRIKKLLDKNRIDDIAEDYRITVFKENFLNNDKNSFHVTFTVKNVPEGADNHVFEGTMFITRSQWYQLKSKIEGFEPVDDGAMERVTAVENKRERCDINVDEYTKYNTSLYIDGTKELRWNQNNITTFNLFDNSTDYNHYIDGKKYSIMKVNLNKSSKGVVEVIFYKPAKNDLVNTLTNVHAHFEYKNNEWVLKEDFETPIPEDDIQDFRNSISAFYKHYGCEGDFPFIPRKVNNFIMSEDVQKRNLSIFAESVNGDFLSNQGSLAKIDLHKPLPVHLSENLQDIQFSSSVQVLIDDTPYLLESNKGLLDFLNNNIDLPEGEKFFAFDQLFYQDSSLENNNFTINTSPFVESGPDLYPWKNIKIIINVNELSQKTE